MPEATKRPWRDAASAVAKPSLPWLRRAFLVVAGLQLFYLVGFNALFWSGGYERLVNGSQDIVRVELGHAWTVRPFVVNVRDLRLTVDEPVVQLEIAVDEAKVGFHVSALLDRLVHMHGVRGGDFVFRLRRRVEAPALTPERLRSLPPIPGLEPPILVPDPDPDLDLSNNWNVRMDDVDVRMREIWIDSERFLGQSQVTGSFTLMTEQSLELPRGAITFDHGVVLTAHRPLALDIRGDAAVAIAQIDFQKGGDALEALTVEADLEAFLFDAGAIGHHFGVEARGGRGPLRIEGLLLAGVVQEGSQVDLSLEDLVVRAGPVHLRTPLELEVTSDGERLAGQLELGGSLAFEADIPTLTISKAVLKGSARAADLRDIGDPKGEIDLQGGTSRFRIGSDPQVTRGQASFSAQLELAQGVVAGAVGGRVSEGALRWGELTFDGGAEALIYLRGTLDPLRLDNAKGEVSLEGDVSSDDDRWYARAALSEAAGSRASGGIGVALQMESLGPLLAIPHFDAEVPDLFEALIDLEDVTAHFGVRWNEDATIFTLHRMECDACAAVGRWRMADGATRGAAIIAAGPVRVGVVSGPEGSSTTLFPGDDWRRRHLPGAQ
jgi:hypothetical protein